MSKTKIGEEQMSDEYYDLERRTEIKAASNRLKKQFPDLERMRDSLQPSASKVTKACR